MVCQLRAQVLDFETKTSFLGYTVGKPPWRVQSCQMYYNSENDAIKELLLFEKY